MNSLAKMEIRLKLLEAMVRDNQRSISIVAEELKGVVKDLLDAFGEEKDEA